MTDRPKPDIDGLMKHLGSAVPLDAKIQQPRVVAATLTLIYLDGSSQNMAFLEADEHGIGMQIQNVKQPKQV